MRYSQEFIDNLVARILSKELRISEASVQYSIGKSTIRYWLEKAKEKSDCVTQEFPSPWPTLSFLRV